MFRPDPHAQDLPRTGVDGHVLACVGPLGLAPAVSEAATWASQRLHATLEWMPAGDRVGHGCPVAALRQRAAAADLVVLGREAQPARWGELERVVESVPSPVLTVCGPFRPPERLLIAFDGSAASRRAVALVAASPLFQGAHCHLLMAGHVAEAGVSRELETAQTVLMTSGLRVTSYQVVDEAAAAVGHAIESYHIDWLVMGAFSHPSWRRWVAGSATTRLLRASRAPTLLVR